MTNTLTAQRIDSAGIENLSLKIANCEQEIHAAQRLRYDVFYTELGAHPDQYNATLQRDCDDYDAICDHLIVVDHAAPKGQHIIGTYRMLTQKRANEAHQKLYTETEFDISKLKSVSSNILEISRSCIHPDYRGKQAINLLWKGIADYVFKHDIDYMVGCPSFFNTTPEAERDVLAYLNAFHACPDAIRPRTLEGHYIPLPQVAKEQLDQRAMFKQLPALLKGYLRVGAMVGDGLYIDRPFNCFDIAVVMPIHGVADRYLRHYTRDNA
jgi:putative hemolysin